jgi:hypothetical protein
MRKRLSDFSTRPDWERDGIEFTWEVADGPIFRCRIARNGGSNNRTDKVRERLYAPFRRMREPSDDMVHNISVRICAEAIALPESWRFRLQDGMCCGDKQYLNGCWQQEVEGSLQPCDPPESCSNVEEGWIRGVEIEPNVIVPNTADNVEKLFHKLPELFNLIAGYSSTVNNYRDKELENDSKNS